MKQYIDKDWLAENLNKTIGNSFIYFDTSSTYYYFGVTNIEQINDVQFKVCYKFGIWIHQDGTIYANRKYTSDNTIRLGPDVRGSFFLVDNETAMKDFNDKIYEFIKKENMVN